METVFHANLAGCNVGNHLGDEEGVILGAERLVGALVVPFLFLEGVHSANANAQHHADACLVSLLYVETAIIHGHRSCCHSKLAIGVHLASFLAVDEVCCVETLHLTGKGGLEVGCIEMGNRGCTAHACYNVLPGFLCGVAKRSYGANARYYYSFQFHK